MRCNTFSRVLTLAAVAMAIGVLTTNAANAAIITIGATAPVVDGEDIANLATVTGTEKLWTDTRAIGQTFTTGSQDVVLDAITLQAAASSPPTKNYTITIGAVSGTSFTAFASESFTQDADSNVDDYWTFTLDSPVTLSANTLYGFDLAMNSSTTGWQSGIPYMRQGANTLYTGGQAYRSQVNAQSTPTFSLINGDKIFHLNMATPTAAVPEPSTFALAALGLLGLAWFGRRRRR